MATSTAPSLRSLTSELLELILDYLSVRDWLAIESSSKSYKVIIGTLKKPTIDALKDHSMYKLTNRVPYDQCLANPLICVEFDFDRYDDPWHLGINPDEYRINSMDNDMGHEYQLEQLEPLTNSKQRLVVIKDLVATVAYFENRGLELESVATALVILASKEYDHARCDEYMIAQLATLGMAKEFQTLMLFNNDTVDVQKSFDLACRSGRIEIVRSLATDPRVDIAAKDNRAFIAAAQGGHYEVVEFLLRFDEVDPCVQDNAAFDFDRFDSDTDDPLDGLKTIKLLLADPRFIPTDETFGRACASKNIEIIRYMLDDPRIDISSGGNSVYKGFLDCHCEDGCAAIAELIGSHPRFEPCLCDDNQIIVDTATIASGW